MYSIPLTRRYNYLLKCWQTRQRVLIAAFARSLRDPFVHGRNAALQALAVTSDLFPEDDCANKILPAICSSLVDKEKYDFQSLRVYWKPN